VVGRPDELDDIGALGFPEGRALSYGALYFPWLQSDARAASQRRNPAGGLLPTSPRVVPPDGVAIGVLAGRASSRGAWIAPANEVLQDVVGLAPIVPAAEWLPLQEAQINLLRADPRGFLALSADTLAHDVELRPITVRRLLILLRRLALRRGITYVFEPNGPALRRAVQRSFEVLMTDLFRRGAFAGAVPEQSFRVVTDSTINTPRDADAGRFLVGLRVAPSLPMRFIRVQLEQAGARLTVSEEL
jgi:phage tail sheath protein FI